MPPRSSARERRSIVMTVRVTPSERAILDATSQSAGIRLADLHRAALLGYQPRTAVDIEAVRQLRRVGTNLNQIALQLNSARGPTPSEGDVDAAIEALLDVLTKIVK